MNRTPGLIGKGLELFEAKSLLLYSLSLIYSISLKTFHKPCTKQIIGLWFIRERQSRSNHHCSSLFINEKLN